MGKEIKILKYISILSSLEQMQFFKEGTRSREQKGSIDFPVPEAASILFTRATFLHLFFLAN